MKDLKVGQKVWIRYAGFDSRHSRDIREGVITKVGRKYFEVNNNKWDGGRFEIETMIESNNSNYKDHAYLSIKDIEEEIEFGNLSSEIRKTFGHYGKLSFSLEQLRAIKEIINPSSN